MQSNQYFIDSKCSKYVSASIFYCDKHISGWCCCSMMLLLATQTHHTIAHICVFCVNNYIRFINVQIFWLKWAISMERNHWKSIKIPFSLYAITCYNTVGTPRITLQKRHQLFIVATIVAITIAIAIIIITIITVDWATYRYDSVSILPNTVLKKKKMYT